MNARVTYNTSGSAGPYTIPFPYIAESDIEVRLDDVTTTNFTFTSATQIALDSAPSATEIEIRRNTQTTPYVDFEDAGVIVEADLDTAFLQSLYIALEADDIAALATTGISDAATSEELATEAAARIAADTTETNARIADVNAEETRALVVEGDLQDQIDSLIAGSGTVPTPANPTDDGKVLTANAGVYDWEPVVASIASTDITDSTAAGRTILTAASAAAQLAAIGAAAATHNHAVADLSDASANGRSLISAADYAAMRLLLAPAPTALTAGATVATNCSLNDYFTLVANTASWTLSNPTNPVAGKRIMWRIKQDATGSRVMSLDTDFRLGADITAVVLSTAANKVDYLGAVYDATDAKWDVVAFVKGY
jgi:hypothetical protein